MVTLAATDPANPYGASLGWPDAGGRGRARRAAGAHVVLAGGRLACFVERGGRSVVTFDAAAQDWAAVAAALAGLVTSRRVDRLAIQRIDSQPPDGHPLAVSLSQHGFTDTPRGLTRRT